MHPHSQGDRITFGYLRLKVIAVDKVHLLCPSSFINRLYQFYSLFKQYEIASFGGYFVKFLFLLVVFPLARLFASYFVFAGDLWDACRFSVFEFRSMVLDGNKLQNLRLCM